MERDHRLRENPNLRHPSGFQTAIHVSKSSLCGYICKQRYRVGKHMMYEHMFLHCSIFNTFILYTWVEDKSWNTFNIVDSRCQN